MAEDNNVRITNAILKKDIEYINCSLTALRLEIKELKAKLDELEGYKPVIKGVIFVSSALALTMLAFLWQLITGQIQLVFP